MKKRYLIGVPIVLPLLIMSGKRQREKVFDRVERTRIPTLSDHKRFIVKRGNLVETVRTAGYNRLLEELGEMDKPPEMTKGRLAAILAGTLGVSGGYTYMGLKYTPQYPMLTGALGVTGAATGALGGSVLYDMLKRRKEEE